MGVYSANIRLPDNVVAPDRYDSGTGCLPPDDFVVTRQRDGSPLSRFGDLVWDFSPYDPHGRSYSLNLYPWKGEITTRRAALSRECRWLLFVLIYLRPGRALAKSTLSLYLYMLRRLAREAELQGLLIRDLLTVPQRVLELLWSEKIVGAFRVKLNSLLTCLAQLGESVTGIAVPGLTELQRVFSEKQKEAREAMHQHPPMPTQIYSTVLTVLQRELDEAERVIDRLLALITAVSADPALGRCRDMQLQVMGIPKAELRPEFPALLQQYELSAWWAERGYGAEIKALSYALNEIRMAALLQVMAYSGMRVNEAESLPFHCYEKVFHQGRPHHILMGKVTKLTKGKVKRVRWVTNDAGAQAVRLLKGIARSIYAMRGQIPIESGEGEHVNGFYLCIGTDFALRPRSSKAGNKPLKLKLGKFKALRERLQPCISEEDLQELEAIDSFRPWRSEEAFMIGRSWTLTCHQFRRSLALYAQRSGLVSLPSLKRQLQHITLAMSQYYARGSAFAQDFIGEEKTHFGLEWQATQPESQCLAYMRDVLLSEAPLSGAHALWVEKRLPKNADGTTVFDRAVTLKAFKRGELAYRETILGGCTNTSECDKTPVDWVQASCLTDQCKHRVTNQTKLIKVIQVEERHLERLKKEFPKLDAHRQVEADLKVLKSELETLQGKREQR